MKTENGKKVILLLIVAFLVLQGCQQFNAYQTQSNDIEGIYELDGVGYCEENTVQLTIDGYETIAAGWPCIQIGAVEDVEVRDEQYCAWLEIEKSAGTPGRQVFEKEWEELCSPTRLRAWGFQSKFFRKYVRGGKLEDLATLLCQQNYQIIEYSLREKYCR